MIVMLLIVAGMLLVQAIREENAVALFLCLGAGAFFLWLIVQVG